MCLVISEFVVTVLYWSTLSSLKTSMRDILGIIVAHLNFGVGKKLREVSLILNQLNSCTRHHQGQKEEHDHNISGKVLKNKCVNIAMTTKTAVTEYHNNNILWFGSYWCAGNYTS